MIFVEERKREEVLVTFFVAIFALFCTPPCRKRYPVGGGPSSVVSQPELQGVGVQVVLPLEKRKIVKAYVVIDEGYRNDQGNLALAI